MANVVDNGKYVRRLGMVMEVLHDDKVLAYAFNPDEEAERGENTMVRVLHDDKVLVYALIPERKAREKADSMKLCLTQPQRQITMANVVDNGKLINNIWGLWWLINKKKEKLKNYYI